MLQPPATFDYRRLLLIACGLPAVLSAVNHFVLQRFLRGDPSILETTLTFALFVVQVGCVGVVVGRYIREPWLRWTLFGWTLLLITMQVSLVANMHTARGRYWELEIPCLAAALFSGLVGFAAVWGVFGVGRWYWRCPAMLLLTLLLTAVWIMIGSPDAWTVAFLTQALAVMAIGAPLRFFGFRLRKLDSLPILAAGTGKELEPLQFQIRHVLAWTTALAIGLGIAKALDLLKSETISRVFQPEVSFVVTLGLCSAIVIVVALWAAIGQGALLLRYSLLVVIATVIGSSIAAYCDYHARRLRSTPWGPQVDWQMIRWYEIGWWWLAWMPLTAGFLVASLLILRTTHYRLVKQRRKAALPA